MGKPPAQRSQSENQTLQMSESKFDLQSAIFGGEDTINSSEFNISCPKVPYAYEGGASGRPPPADMKAPFIGDAGLAVQSSSPLVGRTFAHAARFSNWPRHGLRQLWHEGGARSQQQSPQTRTPVHAACFCQRHSIFTDPNAGMESYPADNFASGMMNWHYSWR